MKKIIIIVLCTLILCSCGKEESISIDEYYLTYNAIDIKPGLIFSNIEVSLEEYNNTYSDISEYNGSSANIYEYDNFIIETYYDQANIEKIYSIRVTSENQPTNEGVKIGDNIDKIYNIYGKEYKNISDNTYLYNINNINICFTINNNIITEIVYYLM